MKKVVRIKESELVNLIDKIITETTRKQKISEGVRKLGGKHLIKENMTIDKIKNYMDDYTYKYWTDGVVNNSDLSIETKNKLLSDAKKTLEKEIEQGLLTDIKYKAELNLINHLLR